jgi:2'-5' RNA ligase
LRAERVPPINENARLKRRYDEIWRAARGKIRHGGIECDEILAKGVLDRRRALTLIARPSAEVRQKVRRFLRELSRIEPEQYYYPVSDLHLTILCAHHATVRHARFLRKLEGFVAAVDAALRGSEPMRIEFRGVTASAGAVVAQGFVEDGTLNELRDELRRQLGFRGLTEGLDVRYRLETAHMTLARFRAPLRDGRRFAESLEEARGRNFGVMETRNLSLVKNDWYMTRRQLGIVKRYRLNTDP